MATEILEAGWRECAIVAARFSLRSPTRCQGFAVAWCFLVLLLLPVLGFCRVGEFGLGFVPDEKSRLRSALACLLSFFLSFAAAKHDDHLRRSGVPLFLC